MINKETSDLTSYTAPYDSYLGKIRESIFYSVGLGACLIAHIIYLIYYFSYGPKFMGYFNIFSVTFYIILLILNFRIKSRHYLITAAIVEIMAHASAAIIFGGWPQGFGLYLLMIMPVPFFIPVKKMLTPYLISLTSFILFLIMCYNFSRTRTAPGFYSSHNRELDTVVYFFNVFMGAGVLFYVSTIYLLTHELMRRKLTAQNESLMKLASIDPLTELFNRRAMGEYLKLIQTNSSHSGSGYVIGIGDIDNFKKINDTYGHSAGDEALRAAAAVFAKCVPSEGYASRWGGEEFLFVIPNADIDKGVVISERIRLAVKDERFSSDAGDFTISITIGVYKGGPDDDIEKVISKADEQLYIGKKNGKDRTQYIS